jgi:hypothetical protein
MLFALELLVLLEVAAVFVALGALVTAVVMIYPG